MNRKGLLQGQGGYGLLPEGRRDVELAARRLAGKGVRVVYSSDQRRALESAEILRRELGIRARVRRTKALRELDFGRMTGLPGRVVVRLCPAWKTDPGFVFPGGESYRGAQARALAWLARLERRRPARVVAVVAHGAILRTLLAALAGIDLAAALEGRVAHGLVARADLEPGGRRLRLLAPTAVLPASRRSFRGPRAPSAPSAR